jgi:hypothetical protein
MVIVKQRFPLSFVYYVISNNRISHICAKVYPRPCVVADLIIFNQNIITIKRAYDPASVIIVNCIIPNYKIMCSCIRIEAIVTTIPEDFIFYHQQDDAGLPEAQNKAYDRYLRVNLVPRNHTRIQVSFL